MFLKVTCSLLFSFNDGNLRELTQKYVPFCKDICHSVILSPDIPIMFKEFNIHTSLIVCFVSLLMVWSLPYSLLTTLLDIVRLS